MLDDAALARSDFVCDPEMDDMLGDAQNPPLRCRAVAPSRIAAIPLGMVIDRTGRRWAFAPLYAAMDKGLVEFIERHDPLIQNQKLLDLYCQAHEEMFGIPFLPAI